MTTQVHKNIMDMFINGTRHGFTITTTNLLPNMVMAFVIIQALKITSLLNWVGHICEPIMALWGLPSEAATILLATLMSMGGTVSVATSLATTGALTSHNVTILLPTMYLMGNPVQNVSRCLGTAKVNAKYYPHIITVCMINTLLSIWVMQLIV